MYMYIYIKKDLIFNIINNNLFNLGLTRESRYNSHSNVFAIKFKILNKMFKSENVIFLNMYTYV